MPGVVLVSCHLCGREFGTASIRLHHPHCTRSVRIISIDWSLQHRYRRWTEEQGRLGAGERRPLPAPPALLPSVLAGTVSHTQLKEYNQAAQAVYQKAVLLECRVCARTFFPQQLKYGNHHSSYFMINPFIISAIPFDNLKDFPGNTDI